MTRFDPKPMAEQQSRYLDALVKVYDQSEAHTLQLVREQPVHVFDFEDGLRLVVTRERAMASMVVVHVTAELVSPGAAVAVVLAQSTGARGQALLDLAEQRWEELSRSRTKLHFYGVVAEAHDRAIPHWFVAAP